MEAERQTAPSLLEQLLAARLEDHLRNVFGLLALTHDSAPHVVRLPQPHRSARSDLRGHTLEYLDNALAGEIRRHVFAVIGDAPLAEKLAEAERQYDIHVKSRSETLQRLLGTSSTVTSDDSFFVAAALHQVFSDRIQKSLQRGLEELHELSPTPSSVKQPSGSG